jgi:hypothetical protein
MAVIKKTLFAKNLDKFAVLVNDTQSDSKYFKITELPDTLTGGKNAFLIAGSEHLVPDTKIQIELKDSAGNVIYHEPGEGILSSSIDGTGFITQYYEGVSKVVAVYVYPDTAYGPCTLTILGELTEYEDGNGILTPVPLDWENKYNVKWQKQIDVNPSLANTTKIRFYKRPTVTISELLDPIYRIDATTGLKVNTGINQSFASIKVSNLETFAGDVKRVKVFRTSLGDISDYDLIQDILVESKELLTTFGLSGSVIGNTGTFTSETLKNYWITGSLTPHLTSSRVESGVALNGSGYFTHSASLDIRNTNTYELNLDAFYSASADSNLGIYLSQVTTSTDGITPLVISSSIATLIGTQPTKNLLDTVIPFKLDRNYPDAKLYFSQSRGEWHLGNISLRLSQDTAFSPDEISFITTMPTVVGNEDFNFKFEFYDVNNNYVPVLVTGSANFTGGSNAITKLLTFESDRTAFRFATGSFANPPNQNVRFKTIKTNFTGGVTYASSAFDVGGNYIQPSSYAGTYPGWFTSQNDNGALLSIASFSGSVSSVLVGSIVYTASCEGFEEYETIYRFEDGDNAPGVFVTANTNQFIYKATDLSLNPSGQIITIEAKRKNLASSITPLTVNSASGTPPLTFVSTNPTNGVDTYTLAGSSYPYSVGERIYYISGSDQFNNEFSDAIKISPVKILDGLSVILTNDNASLPALSTGFIESGSFVLSSGSVSVKVGNEIIAHSNGLSANNRFDVISAVATNVQTGSLNYSTTDYYITRLDADSGSLNLTIRYKDGMGDTTDTTKLVTYTKNKKAAPVLNFVIGNNNQTVTAKSTGEQIDSFVNSTFLVNETYNGATTQKTFTPTSITATNSYSGWTATATSLTLPNLANATDSVDISVTGSVVDSENTTRLVYGNISLAKSKKAVPSVVISATPQSQTVAANSAGVQTGTLANVTITALEGAISRFTSMVIQGTPVGFSTAPTVSGNTLTMTSAVMNADEASVTLTITHSDSEGTTGQTKTITIRASRVKQGESGVVVNLNPASQIVTVSNTGVYGTPTSFVVSVVEGATTYTYDGTSPYAASTFRIANLVGGTNTNATITPTKPTTTSGTNVTFDVIYVNAAGTSTTVAQSHKVSVALDGQTGPGVVFTGVWVPDRAYQFSTGAGTGRRDVVLWSTDGNAPYEVYYAAIRQHTSATGNVANGSPNQTSQTGWESLGTQDFFVAAKIGLFEDSYVQSTLNIGTNSTTTFNTSNITLAGGTAYPYFSLGQAVAGVYNANGIFIGAVNDNGTKYRMSLKSAGNALTWDGSALTVTGAISGGTIAIGSGDTIFKADTSGIYLGNATFADAPFRVTPAGVMTASNATITGNITATSLTLSAGVTISNTRIDGLGALATRNSVNATYIDSNSITTNQIAANTIVAGNISSLKFSGKDARFDTGSIAGWNMDTTGLYKTTGTYTLRLASNSQRISITETSVNSVDSIDRVRIDASVDIPEITVSDTASLNWSNSGANVGALYGDDSPSEEYHTTGYALPDGVSYNYGYGFGIIGLQYANEEIFVEAEAFPDISNTITGYAALPAFGETHTVYGFWNCSLRVRQYPTATDAQNETNANATYGVKETLLGYREFRQSYASGVDAPPNIDNQQVYGATIPANGGGGINTPGIAIWYRVEVIQNWYLQATGGNNDSQIFAYKPAADIFVKYGRVQNGYSVFSPGGLQVYQGVRNYMNASLPAGSTGDSSNFFIVKGKSQIIGSLNVTSGFSANNKQFKIQHPINENKWLYHTSIEAPRADLIYRGHLQLENGSGSCLIDLSSRMSDGTFESFTKNSQLFLQNESGFDRVRGSVISGSINVISENINSNDVISWMVVAERNDIDILKSPLYDRDGNYKTENFKSQYLDETRHERLANFNNVI